MYRHCAFFVLAASFASSCGQRPDAPATDAQGSTAAGAQPGGECSILTAADIKAVTGADVRPVTRGAVLGAGGTCGNYITPDSQAYLGVNRLESQSEFGASVSAVPDDVYPNKQSLAGLGDEAVLFKDETGHLRYLVARNGGKGVVVFPLGGGEISDEQLRQLAERALSR